MTTEISISPEMVVAMAKRIKYFEKRGVKLDYLTPQELAELKAKREAEKEAEIAKRKALLEEINLSYAKSIVQRNGYIIKKGGE